MTKTFDYDALLEKYKNVSPEEKAIRQEAAKQMYLQAVGLGERLYKATDFHWEEGVLTMGDARCVSFTPEGLIFLTRDMKLVKMNSYTTPDEPEWYPDPNDPMTLGLVIDLVRSRWLNEHLSADFDEKKQKWHLELGDYEIWGELEICVWIEALYVEMELDNLSDLRGSDE